MANNFEKEERNSEWEERILEVKRTSKKTKGGNQIAFTVLAVVGNKKGKVGYALSSAKSVPGAIKKAMKKARKSAIQIRLKNQNIPHGFMAKFKGARVVVKPGRKGSGLIAGGVIRSIAQVAGIEDLIAKMLGSANKNANLKAVFKGLDSLRG
ncbi:MAG: 30S ribosomal protein S5 [Candidatus Shapirobacteria bacterium]